MTIEEKIKLEKALEVASMYKPGEVIPQEVTNVIRQNPCIFALVPAERPTKVNQRMFTCIHGKVLTFDTARRVLGFPSAKTPTI